MSRQLRTARTEVKDNTRNPRRMFRGVLAEDYDGIGQFVLVALSQSSVAAAYRARLAAADFGTGQVIPRGTPVSLFVNHGQIEIMSLGAK